MRIYNFIKNISVKTVAKWIERGNINREIVRSNPLVRFYDFISLLLASIVAKLIIVGSNPLMRFYDLIKTIVVTSVAKWNERGIIKREIIGSNPLVSCCSFIKQIIVICNNKEFLGKI